MLTAGQTYLGAHRCGGNGPRAINQPHDPKNEEPDMESADLRIRRAEVAERWRRLLRLAVASDAYMDALIDRNTTKLDELTSTAALAQRWRVTCSHGATSGFHGKLQLFVTVARRGCGLRSSVVAVSQALWDGLHRAMCDTKPRVCAISAEHTRQRLRRAARPIHIVRISEVSVCRRVH